MGADLYIKSIYDKNHSRWQSKFDQACLLRNAEKEGTPEFEILQKEVNKYFDLMTDKGYFRDSYNNSSILWQLGLSWWTDVIPLTAKNSGNMTPAKAEKFKKMLLARPFPPFREWLKGERAQNMIASVEEEVADDAARKNNVQLQGGVSFQINGKNGIEKLVRKGLREWHAFYRKQYRGLIRFLDTAIALKEPIHCSL